MGFYQRLCDLKEDADLTQKQVAEIIGVSTNHYGKYERGETDLPFGKAIQLAEYYGVSLDYLAGLTDHQHSAANLTLSDEQLAVAEQYNCLTEKKGRLELYLEQLLEFQKKQNKPPANQ